MGEEARTTDPNIIRDCASKVTSSGALGTGRVFPSLFEYLVERSLTGEIPREFDIAVDVFGKDAEFRETGDAQIRVNVYKLRARLENYYAHKGRNDPFRLEIPKGTYELVAVRNVEPRDPSPVGTTVPPPRVGLRATIYAAAMASIVTGALLVVAFDILPFSDDADTAMPIANGIPMAAPIWSGMLESDRPMLILLGDHFFFSDSSHGSHIRTRNVSINSEADLRRFSRDDASSKLFETFTYLPKSAVFGLEALLPRARATGKNIHMKLASELTSEELRDYDIVYLGFIRAMGLFRDYYLVRSNYSAESPYLELVHSSSGRTFAQSGSIPQQNRDYGLFARFKGPAGNQVLVFSGIGDVGVLATARSLNTEEGARQLKQLTESSDRALTEGFEVLLEADGHSRTDFAFRIIGVDSLPRKDSSVDTRTGLSVLNSD